MSHEGQFYEAGSPPEKYWRGPKANAVVVGRATASQYTFTVYRHHPISLYYDHSPLRWTAEWTVLMFHCEAKSQNCVHKPKRALKGKGEPKRYACYSNLRSLKGLRTPPIRFGLPVSFKEDRYGARNPVSSPHPFSLTQQRL